MLKRFKFSYLHILTAILLLLKLTVAPGMTYTIALMPSILAIATPAVFALILLSIMAFFKYKHGLSMNKMMELNTEVMSKHKQLKREGHTNEEIKVMMSADLERDKLKRKRLTM